MKKQSLRYIHIDIKVSNGRLAGCEIIYKKSLIYSAGGGTMREQVKEGTVNCEIGTSVTLNETEQKLVRGIAKARFKNNRSGGVVNAKIGGQSDYDTDMDGFGAELAFCKLHNVYPDFSINVRSSANDNGDRSLHMKYGAVDVKCTKYSSGKLITPAWKSKSAADIYALMIGRFPTYAFRGFMKSSVLMVDDRIGDMGHGKKSYIATQDELIDFNGVCKC